jgi:hypothetical protein
MIDYRHVALLFLVPAVMYVGIAFALFDVTRSASGVFAILTWSLPMARAALIAGLSLFSAIFAWRRGRFLSLGGRAALAAFALTLFALSWNLVLVVAAVFPLLGSLWWLWQARRRGA